MMLVAHDLKFVSESVLCLTIFSLAFLLTGISAQATNARRTQPKKPESVGELFNTSSCIPKPYRCPHPKIEFYLYTRRTQNNPELLNTLHPESLYYSQFNRAYPTKVVIHGFGGGRNLAPSTDMRDAYFANGFYNIIIVDYGSLVREPCLSQMDWAPRFCAKCIAQLVHYLSQHPRGVKADDIHMIGYSVGAHIAGLVANYLDPVAHGKLGRITGLDPSIFFYMGNNRSRDVDTTDAHFVDILHTGAGILGQWGPSGHADFYINGGSSQPGCTSDTLFNTLACDHTKVTPYFIESIVTKRGFFAYPCPSLLSFLVGWCDPKDEDYVLMGEHVSHNLNNRAQEQNTAVETFLFISGYINEILPNWEGTGEKFCSIRMLRIMLHCLLHI
ncbi:pancreatic lipase-related protein 2 isoform X1 [Agrilus planipennis]|uniref:Pancreatic lipase-related protein 2 isoform X1 n=1 Tax=Agrilus planipennis TaxID=224129 RepID=A0A1W4WVX8_AGRPL|nr:pancreatic lipase-related protein 2 isoform X1 [Agrilus planipennis]